MASWEPKGTYGCGLSGPTARSPGHRPFACKVLGSLAPSPKNRRRKRARRDETFVQLSRWCPRSWLYRPRKGCSIKTSGVVAILAGIAAAVLAAVLLVRGLHSTIDLLWSPP